MRDILFASNGHGEDVVACKVLDRLTELRAGLSIHAWPMVGEGHSYSQRGIPLSGTRNLLPSAGFATLDWNLMKGDLRAGWIGTHWGQFRDAVALRGRYRLVVAVGDIIPIAAGVLSKSPFLFIGCAKSSYYRAMHGYTGLERMLLRRHCRTTFPRDARTHEELVSHRVPSLYLGNPMMDGLEPGGDRLGVSEDATVIGMLAGTREDAETNLLDLMAGAGQAWKHVEPQRALSFVFAARSQLRPQEMAARIAADHRLQDWQLRELADADAGVVMRLAGLSGSEVVIAKRRFNDVLAMSSLVVGMAGTANEQAIGLGIPLITVPSSGVQGERYVRMKMEYFGDAAVAVPREPEAIGREIGALLADAARQAQMAAAGRERMGRPGASNAIAREVLRALDESNGRRGA